METETLDGVMIAAEARRWVGTPFAHQGRLIGVGVDCVGLVVGVGRACGLVDRDRTDYPRTPTENSLRDEFDVSLDRVRYADMRTGDVLLFRLEMWPQHCGIVSGLAPVTMIHSYLTAGVCVEHSVDEIWRSRIVQVYRYRKPTL